MPAPETRGPDGARGQGCDAAATHDGKLRTTGGRTLAIPHGVRLSLANPEASRARCGGAVLWYNGFMVRDDLRQLAEEAARRERRAWLYVSLVAVLIVVVAFGFIWLTW